MDILNPMGLEVRCKKINGEDYFSMRDLAEVRVREARRLRTLVEPSAVTRLTSG